MKRVIVSNTDYKFQELLDRIESTAIDEYTFGPLDKDKCVEIALDKVVKSPQDWATICARMIPEQLYDLYLDNKDEIINHLKNLIEI